MAEKTTSQSQHNGSQSQQAPRAPGMPGVDAYRKMIDEHMARMGAAFGEIDSMESRALEQARTTIEEGARLFQESLIYVSQLGAEWRRLAMETGRQVAERFATAATTAGQAASNVANVASAAAAAATGTAQAKA